MHRNSQKRNEAQKKKKGQIQGLFYLFNKKRWFEFQEMINSGHVTRKYMRE